MVESLLVDSLSTVSGGVRTTEVLTFLGNLILSIGTIFINTIFKLLIIAGAKLAFDIFVIGSAKHFGRGKLSFFLDSLSPQDSSVPLINIEDASIHYARPYGENLGHGSIYEHVSYSGADNDDTVYVYTTNNRKLANVDTSFE